MAAWMPVSAEPAPLVGHQRDQRAHHHDQGAGGVGVGGTPIIRQRGQLIAQRLPGAGGHHDEAVPSVERRLHGLALARAEGAQPEARQ